MNTRQKHWFFFIVTAIGAIVVVNLAILLMWTDMTEEERAFGKQVFGRVVAYGTLAMVVLFFISSQFILYIFRNYISPIETLTEETRLITLANAKYRIKPVGALETHNLTSVINDLADSYISLKSDVKNIVTESKEGFDEEKSRLEAFMNIAEKGILICNHEGRILKASARAYEIFNAIEHDEVGRFSQLGIGRSIFSVFNRAPIVYCFEQLEEKFENGEKVSVYQFITTRYKKQYLNVRVSPTFNQVSNTVSGYIFTFEDITTELPKNMKAYTGNFILLDEIVSIINMQTDSLFELISENGVWLNIKNLEIIDLISEFLSKSKEKGLKTLDVGLSKDGNIQLKWKEVGLKFQSENKHFNDLIVDKNLNDSSFIFDIKADAYKQVSSQIINDHVKPKPMFYDGSLFDQNLQNKEMDNVLLKDLTFVVFDTETTGVDPSNGDEIISIAGIRIANRKINNEETFDELVNPQRSIPLTSLETHKIYPEMLTDKPTIDKVLPRFSEFVDNAILVAHNAAFDMRFFQLKEKQTGVKFTNPVLDTLLLSAVCHPSQELHNLEDIAKKYDVEIIGRHTALGDSIVTAEVFLKLIPILEAMGIKTLGEAREASQKTDFSKIKF